MIDPPLFVIIGGVAVGVSWLYHRAIACWTCCTPFEKNELTAGSIWHAADNGPTFSTSHGMTELHCYSIALYCWPEAATGRPFTYSVTGAIRLAHTDDRMRAFEHVASWGRKLGAFDGLERTPWYARTGDDASQAALEAVDLNGLWWDAPHEEVAVTREGATADDWLAGKIVNRLPKVGRIRLPYSSIPRVAVWQNCPSSAGVRTTSHVVLPTTRSGPTGTSPRAIYRSRWPSRTRNGQSTSSIVPPPPSFLMTRPGSQI